VYGWLFSVNDTQVAKASTILAVDAIFFMYDNFSVSARLRRRKGGREGKRFGWENSVLA
jgi:hypothetical protein